MIEKSPAALRAKFPFLQRRSFWRFRLILTEKEQLQGGEGFAFSCHVELDAARREKLQQRLWQPGDELIQFEAFEKPLAHIYRDARFGAGMIEINRLL